MTKFRHDNCGNFSWALAHNRLQRLLPFGEVISGCCHNLFSNRWNGTWHVTWHIGSCFCCAMEKPNPFLSIRHALLLLPKATFLSGSVASSGVTLVFCFLYVYRRSFMGSVQHLLFPTSVLGRRAQDKSSIACLPTKHWAGLVAWFLGTWQWSAAIAMELGFQLGFLVFCHVLIGSQVDKQEGRGDLVNIRSGSMESPGFWEEKFLESTQISKTFLGSVREQREGYPGFHVSLAFLVLFANLGS